MSKRLGQRLPTEAPFRPTMKTGSGRGAWIGVIATAFLAWLPPAHAGMTVYGLRDIYRLRLEEISFFVVLLLACVFVVKFLWNHAFKDSVRVPRLKFTQSLCLTTLFGLSTLLVLTMISGIREVLTPDAWRHQGTSYRLNAPSQEPVRRRSLEHLRTALFDYSRFHGGTFRRTILRRRSVASSGSHQIPSAPVISIPAA